ncbi:MAG: hypothetical protein L3J22_09740 [Xanthomonadales bacterium]|nr:hypothetical protein [Xanthomonadales bacterium]
MNNKRSFLLLLLIAVIVIITYGFVQDNSVSLNSSDLLQDTVDDTESELAKLDSNNIKKTPTIAGATADTQSALQLVAPPVNPSEAAIELDHRYTSDNDLGNPNSAVSRLFQLSIGIYETPEDARNAIDVYMQDSDENPYITALLATLCKINNHPFRVENFKNHEKPLNSALYPSCKYFTKRYDPFWKVLKLARNGDEYMQLIASDIFRQAIGRYSIKHYSDPLEYMILRDEVFGYLESLAAKGVASAASKLHWEYMGGKAPDPSFLPKNKLLAYYYGKLAEKLGSQDIHTTGLNRIERGLTTEKITYINQRLDAV